MGLSCAARVLLLLAVFRLNTITDGKRYDGHQLLRVRPTDQSHVGFLSELRDNNEREIDIWNAIAIDHPTDILVSLLKADEVQNILKQKKISYEILNSDIQREIDNERVSNKLRKLVTQVTDEEDKRSENDISTNILGRFPRYSEIIGWIDEISRKRPDIASVRTAGETYEGRHIKVLKLSGGGTHAREAVLIDAGLHAREWLPVGTIIYIINKMVQDYDPNDSSSLLNTFDWYFVPVVNPDGYEYTHVDEGDRLWRKNRHVLTSGNVGVDLNRNFAIGWGHVKKSETSLEYGGESPMSELETRHMAALVSEISPRVYFDLHSYSQKWLIPWACDDTVPPKNDRDLKHLSKVGAAAIKKVHNRKFEVGAPPKILYSACGTIQDWVAKEGGADLSFTLELRPSAGTGNRGFLVSADEIKPSGEEVLAGVKAVMRDIQEDPDRVFYKT